MANLENKIVALGEKQNLLHKLQAENSKYADQVSYQTNIINSMKNKLDKHDAEISLVINNGNGQEEAIDNLKVSLENMKLQINEHYTEMEQIDDMLHLLSKDQDGHVVETLQDILDLNNENKKLIKKLENKEAADINGQKKEDFILSMQKQIHMLQSGFEELKGKIVNVYKMKDHKEDKSSTSKTEIENKFIKTEKISSKQYLPDINNIIKSFQECREKLSNLEINFESVKQDTGNFNDKNSNIENKMMRIIDQTNSIMLKMVQIEEKTKSLELSNKDFDCKLSNLESADIYLQEADRMIIEKMSKMEGDLKKDDIKNYVDDSLLQASKNIDQKYAELKQLLMQLMTEIDKEKLLNNNNYETNEAFIVQSKINGNSSTIVTTNNNQAAFTNHEQLWTVLSELFSAFSKSIKPAKIFSYLCFNLGGNTLLLKSEGLVADELGDVIGVYRLVDSFNDRPLYKQDGGENYIYFR